MIEIGSRRRNQPAPPRILFEALTEPNRDPARPWLHLRSGEVWPRILDADPPALVVWSSLWSARPDAVIRFDLPADNGGGTDLRWTLLIEGPVPDEESINRMRYRLNQLINAKLRYTFGQ